MVQLSEARTLAVACIASGVVSLGAAAVPFSPTAPRGLAAMSGVAALAIGGGLLRAGRGTPSAMIHVVLIAFAAGISLFVLEATTPAGRVLTSYGYVWVAMFTAWFHARSAALAHLGFIGAGFALALAAANAPSPVQTWGFVITAVGGVAVVLNILAASLRNLADRDQLTGLLNRAAFATAAERTMAQTERSGQPLTLALIDLDDFKLVNDRLGHGAGDDTLRRTAAAWGAVLRRGDLLGRHGGDEFVLLMPDTTEEGGAEVLSRLAAADGVRWSAGVAEWRGEPLSPDWLRRVDEALYAHKQVKRRDR